MSAHPPAGADGKMFLVIYLVLSIVVGGAVFFVIKNGEAEEAERAAAMLAEQKAIEDSAKAAASKSKPKEEPTPKAEEKPEPESMMVTTPPAEKKAAKPVVRKPPIKVGGNKVDLVEKTRKEVEALHPYPEVKALMEIVKNWQEVPKNAYPKLVEIRRSVEFEVVENGRAVAKGRLPTGAMMVPVLLEGEILTVTMGTGVPVNVTIPVDETDFKEQVQARYDAYVAKSRAEVDVLREAETKSRLGSMKEEKALFDWNDGVDPRFDVLKQSLKNSEAGDFSLIDVLKWKWGSEEEVEGRKVETAFVLVLSEEAFGEVELELKAFVENGKVVKWIDVDSGQEI